MIDIEIGIVTDIGSATVGLALLLAGAVWLLALAQRLGWNVVKKMPRLGRASVAINY